jgi:hypothetical protein
MNSGILLNRQWLVALGAIVAGALLFTFGRGSIPKAGQSANYTITVVPLDARSLACASDVTMSGRRCSFGAQSQPLGVERPLRPFVTTGRELLLLSGVFESGSVAAWLDAAQKSGDEARVSLDCYAKILGTLPEVLVRWAPNGPFLPEQNVMVADVDDCIVKH